MTAMAMYILDSVGRCFGRGARAVQALTEVSFSIGAGELWAITGPSGSGKSSLLNILGLLDVGYSGSLTFHGERPCMQTAAATCRQRLGNIGFVFQHFHLLDALDVVANVAWPAWRLSGDQKAAWRRAAGLLDQFGLGGQLRQSVSTLSGGEMQRVALARALVNDPPVILADEPTGQLDETNARVVVEHLKKIHQRGKTVVVVSHDPVLLAAAPRVIELRFGRVVRGAR
jgi:ABC-type lipoprotein export system ATPase subunit